MKQLILIAIIIFSLIFLSTTPITSAKEMQGENTVIKINNKDTPIIPTPTPDPKTKLQNLPKLSGNTASFQFSLDTLLIDFGQLSPTDPILRRSTLNIINNNASSYSIFAEENHSLLGNNRVSIPDTGCDNGACTGQTASLWQNTLSYGFGYRCDNKLSNDCSSDFKDQNYFKRFANVENKQQPQTVLSGAKSRQLKQADLTYKVNIAGTQAVDDYSNTITFIMVGGY